MRVNRHTGAAHLIWGPKTVGIALLPLQPHHVDGFPESSPCGKTERRELPVQGGLLVS